MLSGRSAWRQSCHGGRRAKINLYRYQYRSFYNGDISDVLWVDAPEPGSYDLFAAWSLDLEWEVWAPYREPMENWASEAHSDSTQVTPSIDWGGDDGDWRGTSGTLSFYGKGLGKSPEFEVTGSGLSMYNGTWLWGSAYYATYTIDAEADSGSRTFQAKAGGYTSGSRTFKVWDRTPDITDLSNNVWPPGFSGTIQIYGTDFGCSPTVKLVGNASSEISLSLNSFSDTLVEISVTVPANATTGDRHVVVTSHGWGPNGFKGGPGAQADSNENYGTVHVQ